VRRQPQHHHAHARGQLAENGQPELGRHGEEQHEDDEPEHVPLGQCDADGPTATFKDESCTVPW
jgi:hypothetical protein